MQANVNTLSNEYEATKTKLSQVEKELEETTKTSDDLKQQVQRKDGEMTTTNPGFQEMEKEVIKQLNAVEDKIGTKDVVQSSTRDNSSLSRLKEFFNNRIDGLE